MKYQMEAKEAKKDTYKLTETEKESIGKLIEKYQAQFSTAEEEKDRIAGSNLLRKYEDDARITVERDLKKHQEDPNDQLKKVKYYNSREKYLLISKMSGLDSPAKVAAL